MQGWVGTGERSFGGECENSGQELPAGEKGMYPPTPTSGPPRQLLVNVASQLLPCTALTAEDQQGRARLEAEVRLLWVMCTVQVPGFLSLRTII